jgi:ABC-type transport system substrate-binding protein
MLHVHRSGIVLFVALLMLAACAEGTEESATTTTTTSAASPATTAAEDPAAGPVGTYRMGMAVDVTTDNWWAAMGPEADMANWYAGAWTHSQLFALSLHGLLLVPDLAADGYEPAQLEGDTWVAEVPIRSGYSWSDGVEVTADDFVFTYETVRDLGLDEYGNFPGLFPLHHAAQVDDPATESDEARPDKHGVISISAPDEYTVRIEFSSQPGLSVWPHGIGLAWWMPEHFWAQAVEEARTSDDPAEMLFGRSGLGEPAAGLTQVVDREPGSFVLLRTNPDAYNAHTHYYEYGDGSYRQRNETRGFDECFYGSCSGANVVDYEIGPFVDEVVLSVYPDSNAAVMALTSDEIDYYLSSIGLPTGLKDQVLAEPQLQLVANPSNGWRYLAFNMRTSPGRYKGFRKAIGCVTDKEFMQTLLQGAALPAYSLVPASNTAWANPDVEKLCEGLSAEERFERALTYLNDPALNEGGSFTWEVDPVWDPDNQEVQAGTGTEMRDPDGVLVPELELLAPGPGYDPLRSTYAVWIAEWASNLGIPLEANPTGFSVIVDKVWAAGEDALNWDMYILGWGLGDPSLPTFHEAFFASWQDSAQGGFNTPGYADDRVDQLATELLEATEIEAAKALVRELDQTIVDDAPYIVLFSTPVLDAYRADVTYPFTDTLDGLQSLGGLPQAVRLID